RRFRGPGRRPLWQRSFLSSLPSRGCVTRPSPLRPVLLRRHSLATSGRDQRANAMSCENLIKRSRSASVGDHGDEITAFRGRCDGAELVAYPAAAARTTALEPFY